MTYKRTSTKYKTLEKFIESYTKDGKIDICKIEKFSFKVFEKATINNGAVVGTFFVYSPERKEYFGFSKWMLAITADQYEAMGRKTTIDSNDILRLKQ